MQLVAAHAVEITNWWIM